MILSKKRITKALIRLRGCAGWFSPMLFSNPLKQGISYRGQVRQGLRNMGHRNPYTRVSGARSKHWNISQFVSHICEQRMLRRASPNETSNHGSLHCLLTQKRRNIDENVSQNVTHFAKLHYIAVQICIKNCFYAYAIDPKIS